MGRTHRYYDDITKQWVIEDEYGVWPDPDRTDDPPPDEDD